MSESNRRVTSSASDVVSTADGSIFDQAYYEHDCGVPYEASEHWLEFFGTIADHIVRDLHPASGLDAGCAMGFLVEQLLIRGVDAYGIDVSQYAISKVPEAVGDRCRVGSLVEPLDGHHDLVTCIEVLEHMAAQDARKALANICAVTDRVLFSSSPNDYAEPTHVNVRPPEDWAADFAAHGFFRNLDYDASYVAPWAALYERRSADPREIVRAYERVQARRDTEMRQLRESALNHRGEVEVIRAELLSARDTVVGLEVELGDATSERNAALHEYEQLVASKAFRATTRVLAPYRRLRNFMRR